MTAEVWTILVTFQLDDRLKGKNKVHYDGIFEVLYGHNTYLNKKALTNSIVLNTVIKY